jgi:hypothetical protein
MAHQTVNSDCLVHHQTVLWPHMSELQWSNPNGWVTWLAHRTVRCALWQQPLPTATLVVGAINTPNHHTSKHLSFQPTHSIQELVHSIQDTKRVNQNLSKSQFHSKQLKETRSLWPPQWGVGLQEPNLGKTNHHVIRSYLLVICFRPHFRTRLYF